MKRAIAAAILVLAPLGTASAQTTNDPRRVVFADAGYAKTLDDEGTLGSGAGLRLGAGYRISPRLTIQAVVDRIPYYRDLEYLTFDGRVLFWGVEAALQSRNPQVRRFVTVGVGMMHDERVWIHKRTIDPRLPRVEERTELDYTLSMLTASGGLDIRVTDTLSIRSSLRFHGLLDTGDDLAPHIILQPTIGGAWRW